MTKRNLHSQWSRSRLCISWVKYVYSHTSQV